MRLKLWVPAPCSDVCGEDNEGDESGVGRQHPRSPLKTGRWQPPPGNGGVWVTACLILLFLPLELQPAYLVSSSHQRDQNPRAQVALEPVVVWVTPGDAVPPVTPARRVGAEPAATPESRSGCRSACPVSTTSSKRCFPVARNFVWVFVCLDGVFQLKASRGASEPVCRLCLEAAGQGGELPCC